MAEELTVDLTNYKDRVGARIKPGTYRVQVEDAELSESSAKNPMINVWFRVLGGEFDGQTVVDRITITEKSLFRVVGFMQGIGLPTPKKRLKLNVRSFIGKVLDIQVDDGEPYNGRVKSEVRNYIRVASTGGADLETAEDPFADDTSVDLPEIPDSPAGLDASDDLDLDTVQLD
jgi:hypothetical protein